MLNLDDHEISCIKVIAVDVLQNEDIIVAEIENGIGAYLVE
jgi:hypothetical protein